jgi:uncharacterized protein YggE
MMKASDKVTYIALGALILFAFRPVSDKLTSENDQATSAPKTITVTGSADMTVVPDKVEVNISYNEYWIRSHSPRKKAKIEDIEDQITKCITAVGISKKDIVISDAFNWHQHWYYWYYWYKNNHLYGKSMIVKLRNMDDLEGIIKNIRDQKVDNRSIVSIKLGKTSHSDIQEYRKAVKTRAIQAAKEKAGYLLDGVGNKLGAVISIRELDDVNTSKKTTTTQRYGYGYPWYDPWYGYGRGYQQTVQSGGMNNAISNSSVSQNSFSGVGNTDAKKQEELGMKPIRLRYEIQAVFAIKS